MQTTIDSVGRVVVPKAFRDALGLTPGSAVDISLYGAGLQLVAAGGTARLEKIDGSLVAVSETVITDDDVQALLDAGRK